MLFNQANFREWLGGGTNSFYLNCKFILGAAPIIRKMGLEHNF